jgi:hypothetical protein
MNMYVEKKCEICMAKDLLYFASASPHQNIFKCRPPLKKTIVADKF